MKFGEKVKALRKKAGLTQEQLAERCGRGKSYICNIEKGTRTTTLDNVPNLATALGVSIGELIDPDEVEPSSPYLEFIPYLAQADEVTLNNIRAILGMPKKNVTSEFTKKIN